jgi:hypothetical protein
LPSGDHVGKSSSERPGGRVTSLTSLPSWELGREDVVDDGVDDNDEILTAPRRGGYSAVQPSLTVAEDACREMGVVSLAEAQQLVRGARLAEAERLISGGAWCT